MGHVFIHALLDTLQVFVVVFILYILLSFIEGKLANKIKKANKYSPIIGASIGLIPQCGFSIVSADLYSKKHITMGTLIAVFVACSDEAVPIIISNPDKFAMVFPLLAIKFVVAIGFGYLVDLIFRNRELVKLTKEEIENDHDVHIGCCHHEIEEEHDEHHHESNVHKHLLHPLIHSLKIGLYVLIVNIIFGLLFHFVGEDNVKNFLNENIYLTPLFSSLVGLIPNCAASVIISELYIENALSFGATIAGLITNAGLGLLFLYKDRKQIKNNLLITGLLLAIGIIVGYITLAIELI